jgi:hypothetical protein
MRTPDKLEPLTRTGLPSDHQPGVRTSLAHAAMCAAQLVIARTINASRFPPMPPPHMRAATVQARHYARVQSQLQAWINKGGFSAPGPATPCVPNDTDDTDCDACVD